jgi:hypothetical protein
MKRKKGRSWACWRCSPWSRTRGGAGGRRYPLAFILAVAVACALAGARNFRAAGNHAADLPQDILARLGGRPHPLLRKITAPSKSWIRTMVHAIGADLLDEVIGSWLRGLADAGSLDGLPAAIAIDGKWLRGALDGQVKLFAAMLHERKVIIAQHRIPDETTETTQVRELLDAVDLDNAVVTADAVHAQRETAEYIAGKKEDGNRESDYFLLVKDIPAIPPTGRLRRHPGTRPARAGPHGAGPFPRPGHPPLPLGRRHGGIDFPHVSRVARIRRNRYDADGSLISKEIVHAVTSLGTQQASPASLAKIARGQRGIESVYWLRDTAYAEDANTRYVGKDPRSWPRGGFSPLACSISSASKRSPAPSRPSPATESACWTTYRYETQISNDFGDPVGPVRVGSPPGSPASPPSPA